MSHGKRRPRRGCVKEGGRDKSRKRRGKELRRKKNPKEKQRDEKKERAVHCTSLGAWQILFLGGGGGVVVLLPIHCLGPTEGD